MGVQGLTGYVLHDNVLKAKGALKTTNIHAYIADWKQKHLGCEAKPKLVFDGTGIIQELYGKLDWVCQGQWKQYVESVKTFVSGVKAMGVDPIFFFDGSVEKWKMDIWVHRRKKELEYAKEFYEQLKRGISRFDKQDSKMPGGIPSLTVFLIKYECNTTVFQTTCDADAAIADFVNKTPGCIGVVGTSSDFMIYEMNAPFLLCSRCDELKTNFEVLVFDQRKFTDALAIPQFSLPLLACLVGNNSVPQKDLRKFHESVVPAKFRDREKLPVPVVIQEVAKFVGKQTRGQTSLTATVILAVGNVTHIDTAKLSEGIEMYNKAPEELLEFEVPVSEALKQRVIKSHIEAETYADVLSILRNGEFTQSSRMEDGSLLNLRSGPLLQNLRQKIYGVLVAADASSAAERQTLREMYSYEGNEMKDFEEVEALSLSESVPFEDLFDDVASIVVKQKVLLEMCYSNEGGLSWIDFGDIPKSLIALVLTLRYFRRFAEAEFQDWELNAYIAQAVIVQSISAEDLGRIKDNTIIPRAVHLAALFTRALMTVQFANCVAGQPIPLSQTMPWFCFDGKLFHETYAAFKLNESVDELLKRHGLEEADLYRKLQRLVFK